MADNRLPLEEYTLRDDAGQTFSFRGRLFSEQSYFDEESGNLNRMRLYVAEDKQQIYSVVSGSGDRKTRQVYTLQVEGDLCHIGNGAQSITLNTEMLLAAVFGLCGINAARAEEWKGVLEETLHAVNI